MDVMSSVDVVIPCYKYGHFLNECVKSVLTQSGPNVRVLVIDDASPDNTAEVAVNIAKKDSRVTFLRHTTNIGHIKTFNQGIDWASADYMLILSADDYLLPGALSRAATVMDKHPEIGLTFGRAAEHRSNRVDQSAIDGDGRNVSDQWQIFTGLEFIGLSGGRNLVNTPSAIVRTALQKRLGGYRLELTHTGDMEMWLRFAAHASVAKTEAYQAVYRRHSTNMSLDYFANGWLLDLHQRKVALECFFASCGPTLPNADQLRRKLFRSLAACAVGYASSAFNKQELQIVTQLCEFAIDTCPDVKQSWAWRKLTCKQRLGFRAWKFLSENVPVLRQANQR